MDRGRNLSDDNRMNWPDWHSTSYYMHLFGFLPCKKNCRADYLAINRIAKKEGPINHV
jgi:hypothetical protein